MLQLENGGDTLYYLSKRVVCIVRISLSFSFSLTSLVSRNASFFLFLLLSSVTLPFFVLFFFKPLFSFFVPLCLYRYHLDVFEERSP